MNCLHIPERGEQSIEEVLHLEADYSFLYDDSGKPPAGAPDHFVLDLRITCKLCGEPMHFIGDFDLGVRFDAPTVNLDQTKISLSFAPGRKPKLSGRIMIPRVPTVKT